jgi:hypothetical protein
MKTKSWKLIKDEIYGEKGTERRDQLERDFEVFKNRWKSSVNRQNQKKS